MKDILQKIKSVFVKLFQSRPVSIITLIALKTFFQFIVVNSGLRWLTADDYSRTVISWDWLQSPRVYSGVWLSLHFWINGIFIWLFKDLTLAPIIANTFFSIVTLVFLYLLTEKIFSKGIAFVTCLIFAVFPFQVWLSSSGMPESVFFCFITISFYYFLQWYKDLKAGDFRPAVISLIISCISLNIANLLRYEGWFFSISLVLLTGYLSYRKFKFSKQTIISAAVSLISILSALWWMYENSKDYGDAFFFIKETTKIYAGLASAGLIQRIVQYPFFIFYIAPLTTVLGLWKIIRVIMNKPNGFKGDFSMLRVFLLFNLLELFLLMLSGIFGSGGTNMISRYIVINAIMLFPFAVWQLTDLRKYILVTGLTAIILVNIIWCFYYQQAYRDDTYEVADLTKQLIQKKYFAEDEKIYFERVEGYYDIYPLQVISNHPGMFTSDTIPSYFPPNVPVTKKTSKKKNDDEQQKMNILELRKFLEAKKIKLFIVRSDLLIDKLKKLSYKNEQIGDYRIFYLSENKIEYKKGSSADTNRQVNFQIGNKYGAGAISFGKKLILKDFYIDNTNFGLNPQTVTLKWNIADISVLDSLQTADDDFGRYKTKIQLVAVDNDTVAYDTYANVFSERNVEQFFENEEIKNIMILKPFAMLNYSRKFKSSPFESGLYELRLSVIDDISKKELTIFRGDSLYIYAPDKEPENKSDTVSALVKIKEKRMQASKDKFLKDPYYPLGNVIAMFPNADYSQVLRKSSDLSKILIRNGLMLPFLNRYQGDHFLNVVFTYF